jgi:hypothetical protein
VLVLTTSGNAVVVQRVPSGHTTVEPGDQVLSIEDCTVVGKDWKEVRKVIAKHTPSASIPVKLMFLKKGEITNCSFEGPIICNRPLIEPITLANYKERVEMLMETGVDGTYTDVWEHLLVHNTHLENIQLHSDILMHFDGDWKQSIGMESEVLTALQKHGNVLTWCWRGRAFVVGDGAAPAHQRKARGAGAGDGEN